MPKVMMFVDGTWLYCNTPKLSEACGKPEYRVNFGKMPAVLCGELANLMSTNELDLVRVNVFGSYAVNHDARDNDAVQRRRDFFDLLRDEFRYDVETYPINFMGRSLRRADRDPEDNFGPRETVASVALASSMLYHAALPGALDIALFVGGDTSVNPALRRVRLMGKRVAMASIREACARSLTNPRTDVGVIDTSIIWLDDHLDTLELTYEEHTLHCEKCAKDVETTFHPRRSQKFYCDDCRTEFAKRREDIPDSPEGAVHTGVVRRKMNDKGYGFIEGSGGKQYFFHLTDLDDDFENLIEGEAVEFEVKREPDGQQAGAAQFVRVIGDDEE